MTADYVVQRRSSFFSTKAKSLSLVAREALRATARAATISRGSWAMSSMTLRATPEPLVRQVEEYTSPQFTTDINNWRLPSTPKRMRSSTFSAPGRSSKRVIRALASRTMRFIARARARSWRRVSRALESLYMYDARRKVIGEESRHAGGTKWAQQCCAPTKMRKQRCRASRQDRRDPHKPGQSPALQEAKRGFSSQKPLGAEEVSPSFGGVRNDGRSGAGLQELSARRLRGARRGGRTRLSAR